MKKRITIIGLCLAVSLCLCACEESDNLKDAAKGVRDVVSKYGQQIEDSKEQLEAAANKLQDILEESHAD